MKITYDESYKAGLGDMVTEPRTNDMAIIVYLERAYIDKKDLNNPRVKLEFPYLLIDITTGKVINSYKNLEQLNKQTELVAKSSDMELIIKR